MTDRPKAQGRGKNIGFFVVLYYQPNAGANVYIDQTLVGVVDAIASNRDNLILRFSEGVCEEGHPSMRSLANPDLDGAILLSPHVEDEKIDFLRRLGIPVVFTFFQPKDPSFGCIDMDNAKGARMAVEHLLHLGHRRIAFIGGDITLSSNARDRYRGYQETILEAGIVENPALVRHGDFSLPFGYEAMRSILELPVSQRPTAVFGATDLIALGAIQAAHQAGLRVPWDLSVVGFDDIETAQTSDPPLTTIHQPFPEIGEKSVALLRGMLQDPNAADRRWLIPPSLVIRSSAAPPQRARNAPLELWP